MLKIVFHNLLHNVYGHVSRINKFHVKLVYFSYGTVSIVLLHVLQCYSSITFNLCKLLLLVDTGKLRCFDCKFSVDGVTWWRCFVQSCAEPH